LNGKDLRKEPLVARRKLLANLLKKPPEQIRLSDELRADRSSPWKEPLWPAGFFHPEPEQIDPALEHLKEARPAAAAPNG
jgi:hypothetical protein